MGNGDELVGGCLLPHFCLFFLSIHVGWCHDDYYVGYGWLNTFYRSPPKGGILLSPPSGGAATAGGDEAKDTTLDYSNISRTFRGSKNRHPRFSGDCWHTVAFRDFAFAYLHARYNYLGIDVAGDIHMSSGSLIPRWSEERQKRSFAQIYSWAESLENASDLHFVTLTAWHPTSGTYASHRDTLQYLRDAWGIVSRQLRRWDLRYLRVIEPGELRGYPHIHLVLVGASDAACEALVRSWCRALNNRGNPALPAAQDWQRVDDVARVGAYVSKYLQKTVNPAKTAAYWRWMELCYRERLRVFAMDARSADYIRRKYPRQSGALLPWVLRDIDWDP